MVVAGDWFLAWQAKQDPLSTQLGAMIYFLPCALALIVAMIHREDAPWRRAPASRFGRGVDSPRLREG
jgi:F0F1-type ATP synthase assembly protein I